MKLSTIICRVITAATTIAPVLAAPTNPRTTSSPSAAVAAMPTATPNKATITMQNQNPLSREEALSQIASIFASASNSFTLTEQEVTQELLSKLSQPSLSHQEHLTPRELKSDVHANLRDASELLKSQAWHFGTKALLAKLSWKQPANEKIVPYEGFVTRYGIQSLGFAYWRADQLMSKLGETLGAMHVQAEKYEEAQRRGDIGGPQPGVMDYHVELGGTPVEEGEVKEE